jgi:hypothetical protein
MHANIPATMMDKTQLTLALIGSAAVGALISSVITALAQWRERKSRREELLLTKAIEMAQSRVATVLQSGFQGKIMPEIEMAQQYHRYLKHLLEHGKLPEDYQSKMP